MIGHRAQAVLARVVPAAACLVACLVSGRSAIPRLAGAAAQQVQRVRVDVNTGIVSGCCAAPDSRITVSWRSADGHEKRSLQTRVGSDGSFAQLPGVAVELGDVVAVFFDAGDPQLVPVLQLTGVPNSGTDEVGGLAPPGTQITVRVAIGKSGVLAERRAVTDASGRYTVSFAGIVDVFPGCGGPLVAQLDSGHELVGAWVAPGFILDLGESATLRFLAPAGMTPDLHVLDADDRPIATGRPVSGMDWIGKTALGGIDPAGRSGGTVLEFYAYVRDALDADVEIRAGDVVRLRLPEADSVTHWTVPRLEASFFVDEDRVTGTTLPNHAVTLTLNAEAPWHERRRQFGATADAGGRFTFDLAGSFDLAFQDGIVLEVGDPGRVLRRHVTTPGLNLDLDSARLAGSSAPNGLVRITATVRGSERYRAQEWTNGDGASSASLVDADGMPLALTAGDTVTIQPIGQPAGKAVTLTVPELTAMLDPASGVVAGRASPSGQLYVEVSSDALPHPSIDPLLGTGGGNVTIAADGAWSVPVNGLAPGSRASITYRLPVGHIVTMRRIAPVLAAEVGGARLCGLAAAPRQPVSATLHASDGTPLATAERVADAQSTFDLQWRRDTGVVKALPSQVARADLGGRSTVELQLVRLTATMDWRTYDLAVQGPSNLVGGIRIGARSACGMLVEGGNTSYLYLDGNGQAASKQLPWPAGTPGTGLTVWAYLPDGHVLFRHLPRPTAYLYTDTDHVSGWAEAGQTVTVVQLAADGTEIGRAATTATDAGRFETKLTANGRPSRIVAGQVVRLIAGGLTENVPISTLDLDWSTAGPVLGRTDPGAVVELQLALADGRHRTMSRVADANGRFGLTALDVPLRADWSLGDVAAVRALVPVLTWHRWVVETDGFDVPRSRPPAVRGENMLFLPVTWVPRR